MTDPLPSLRGCPSVAKGDAAISTAIRAISEADCFNRLRRSRNDRERRGTRNDRKKAAAAQ